VITVGGDVADEDAMAAAFDTIEAAFGGIDVVVNTAGIMLLSPIAPLNLADLDRMHRTNIRGTFVVSQLAASRLRAGGALINFSATVTRTQFPAYGGYVASKAAVEGMTLILVRELRGKDITVNAAYDTKYAGLVDQVAAKLAALAPPDADARMVSDQIARIGFFACGYNVDLWSRCLRIDPDEYFDDVTVQLAPDAESIVVLANPVQAHSEGAIVLASADPLESPDIRMNYFSDPHDMKVMVAIIRRVLDLVAKWPAHREISPLMIHPFLATKHGHAAGDVPSDALLEDLARHYSITVYHLTSTCRIGGVVDARLRVNGVANLRVTDASVMPNVVSGNTNAASIMIGEKAAEMIEADHGVSLNEFVGSTL
jgi:NAD(P)-dependent dehydrogenase (short-subunit alcohol dehydrogenase family)